MEQSDQLNELAAALSKAQADIKSATKDRSNDFYGSKYATLDAVMEACRTPLASNGLAVVQGATATGETVTVTTMLIHTSGQWIKESLSLVPRDASPQAAGSALTYARRYGLGALVGVTAEDDDDGNAAQPPKAPQAAKATRGRDFAKPPVPTLPAGEIGQPRPATDPEDPALVREAATLFKKPAEEAERALLVKDLKRLSVALKLNDTDKQQYGRTYLGETVTVAEADLADLIGLVDFLRHRAGESPWATRHEP
mgnify:FL=1